MTLPDLTGIRALSFDCYGTLIDWEEGIGSVLDAWAEASGVAEPRGALLERYAGHEAQVMREEPGWLYPRILAEAFTRTGAGLGTAVTGEWADRLGSSVPDWPAFPDSADALAVLARRYELIIVSNVHEAGFTGSNRHLRGAFDRVITAEEVGGYKPGDRHFTELQSHLAGRGLAPRELLHVAQSLFHDHVPAQRHGLTSVWIDRRHDQEGWGATPPPEGEWSAAARYPSMAAFADAVAAAVPERR